MLGRALAKSEGVRLLAFVFVSNHYVMLLQVENTEVLSKFMNYLNGNLAREAGRLHNWPEKFWGRRYTDIPVVDEESLVARLRYVLAHGVKEGLVERAAEWPGATCLPALVEGKTLQGVWFDRTAEYYARRRGGKFDKYAFAQTYEVPLSPLPCWEHLTEQQRQARVAELVADIEQEARANNRALGRKPLGRDRVLSQDPHGTPKDSKHSPRPLCHAATKAARKACIQAIRAVQVTYRAAAKLVSEGRAAEAEFPPGCFPPALPFVAGEPAAVALSP